MEFFSHVHPATPLVLYLPVVICMLYVAIWQRVMPLVGVAGLFVLGLLIWTLLEYVIHRWVFHYEPTTQIGKRLHFIAHGVHHDYPNDAKRLVMPPVISLPLAVVFFAVFALVFGRFYSGVFAGFTFGYICYDTIHYATHHFPMRGWLGLKLKQYHLQHHYKDDHAGYGVSTPLWDYVFGTTRR